MSAHSVHTPSTMLQKAKMDDILKLEIPPLDIKEKEKT
jgi:hypothetical protein